MKIKISVLKTKTATNETFVKDFNISGSEWESNEIEILAVEGQEARIRNESFNAFIFVCSGFGDIINLPEDLDFDEDIENIFPIYTASDRRKRKRGYIFDLNEKDGIKTRIILVAPRHYLSSLL